MTSDATTHGSFFHPTGKKSQCITVFFSWQKTMSLIGVKALNRILFPPTLDSRQPLIVLDAQVFNSIGVHSSSSCISNMTFFALLVDPTALQCRTHTTCPLNPLVNYGVSSQPHIVRPPWSSYIRDKWAMVTGGILWIPNLIPRTLPSLLPPHYTMVCPATIFVSGDSTPRFTSTYPWLSRQHPPRLDSRTALYRTRSHTFP